VHFSFLIDCENYKLLEARLKILTFSILDNYRKNNKNCSLRRDTITVELATIGVIISKDRDYFTKTRKMCTEKKNRYRKIIYYPL